MKKILFFILTLTCAVPLVNARKITINNTSEYMPLKVLKNAKTIAEIAPHGSFSQDMDNPFQPNQPFMLNFVFREQRRDMVDGRAVENEYLVGVPNIITIEGKVKMPKDITINVGRDKAYIVKN